MQELRLGTSEIDRLRGTDLKNLMRGRKLVLILDLDHTLINSTRLQDLSSAENELGIQTIASEGNVIHLFYKPLEIVGIPKNMFSPFVHDYKILPPVQIASMWL
jgi:hypothetical protein